MWQAEISEFGSKQREFRCVDGTAPIIFAMQGVRPQELHPREVTYSADYDNEELQNLLAVVLRLIGIEQRSPLYQRSVFRFFREVGGSLFKVDGSDWL